jgi:starch synthase
MRIAHVAAEVHPFAITGGLGGVVGSLPGSLAAAGHQVAVFMPFYSRRVGIEVEWLPGTFRTAEGEEFGVALTSLPGNRCPVYMIAREGVFDRDGLYGPSDWEAYPDNPYRFSFFSRAVLETMSALGEKWDVVHCHDWHAGLIPVYCRLRGGPATVLTIHNLAFQGRFPAENFAGTGLPPSLFAMEGVEFYGDFSFLKGGILFADRITTVSPTYSREILQPDRGEGLDGVLRSREQALSGILNGIDYDLWGPEDDPSISAWFTASNLRNRRLCREDLMHMGGLHAPAGTAVAGIVSRLTSQKGMDLAIPVLEELLQAGRICVAVVGTGERLIEEEFTRMSRLYPWNFFYRCSWDESLSRKIYAGSDFFLMPSRFEPCGLSQMIAMRYGSIPVVRRTGGLADTVTPASMGGNGFLFDGEDEDALRSALSDVLGVFADRRKWLAILRRAMTSDNSWTCRVPLYEKIYSEALSARNAP